MNSLLNSAPQDLAPRVGVAHAKFPALVAAMSSTPLGATRVPADAASFLAPHSIDLLPVDSTVKVAMHRFGLHAMGDVAAMALEKMVDQFGLTGKAAWNLCHGVDDSPLAPMKHEESVVERISLPFSSNSLEFLVAAVDTLLKRAYSRPGDAGPVRRQGQPAVRPLRDGRLGEGRTLQAECGKLRASVLHHQESPGDRPSTGACGGGHPGPRRPHGRVGGADGPAAGRP